MEDIFYLSISANHTPTSKLDAYFHIAPCDFVFLLHQCSPLVFWYLYLGSRHLEACEKSSGSLCTWLGNPLEEGEIGKTNHVQYLPVYYLKSESIFISAAVPREMASSCWKVEGICVSGIAALCFTQLSCFFFGLCAFLEKYMVLWFSFKEMFLIMNQNELNSLIL